MSVFDLIKATPYNFEQLTRAKTITVVGVKDLYDWTYDGNGKGVRGVQIGYEYDCIMKNRQYMPLKISVKNMNCALKQEHLEKGEIEAIPSNDFSATVTFKYAQSTVISASIKGNCSDLKPVL